MTQLPERTFLRRLSDHLAKRLVAAVVLLAALGLAACAQKSVTVTAAMPEKTRAAPSVKPPLAVPTAVSRAAPPAIPRPVPLTPKVYPPPSHLAGLDGEQVFGLLGSPGFKRKDDPALIWQYRTKACALDLFLYRAGDGTPYRVRHFESRSRGKEAVSARDCFVSLLRSHEQRPAG